MGIVYLVNRANTPIAVGLCYFTLFMILFTINTILLFSSYFLYISRNVYFEY
jgi:hypothetical protein